jgi:ribosomal protein L29
MGTKAQKQIAGLGAPELAARLTAAEGELFKARMNQATGQLGNTATLWKLRKEIARIKTAQTKPLLAKSATTTKSAPAAKASAAKR